MSISTETTNLRDEEVLSASRKNPELFAVLVDRYEAAFLRKAKSIIYSHEDAEEVVQDAFTRIYVYADRYTPQEGASFSSWAYAILTRLAFTRYQKLKKKRSVTQDLDPELYEKLGEEDVFLEDLSIRSEVLAALARIPDTAARILRLQFIEGKTQEEIAALEGSTVSAVKTRVHRAKKQFKDALQETNQL
ncbi:MAG: RNA polymerase sigma-70 factor, ECF subfamily [Parcubacteria bacterium C7867-001]|nr:MAG: RNA polymerase sigma-70 factor, ECF subfamily [Parcubacteria bacterium C7867-001]